MGNCNKLMESTRWRLEHEWMKWCVCDNSCYRSIRNRKTENSWLLYHIQQKQITSVNCEERKFKPKTLYTHRPLPKNPKSPGPIKITTGRVQYTNQYFILLLFKILWVLSTEKGEHQTCCNMKLTQCMCVCVLKCSWCMHAVCMLEHTCKWPVVLNARLRPNV